MENKRNKMVSSESKRTLTSSLLGWCLDRLKPWNRDLKLKLDCWWKKRIQLLKNNARRRAREKKNNSFCIPSTSRCSAGITFWKNLSRRQCRRKAKECALWSSVPRISEQRSCEKQKTNTQCWQKDLFLCMSHFCV